MLVSHRYKFFYTKTCKIAGSSVESYFERFCMPEGEWTQQHFRDQLISDTGIVDFRGDAAKRGMRLGGTSFVRAAKMKPADRYLSLGEWNSYRQLEDVVVCM
jgi:hypothetical protein